jgi:hypothetical protein
MSDAGQHGRHGRSGGGVRSGPMPDTMTATLEDGPLAGRTVAAGAVEGRPPKTLDLPADDGTMCRYCLAGWVQEGHTAVYSFLYRV